MERDDIRARATHLNYDNRYPHDRKVRFQIDEDTDKHLILEAIRRSLGQAHGVRVHDAQGLTEVVVSGLGGTKGESAGTRAAAIAKASGLKLGERSPKWLVKGRSQDAYEGFDLTLRFTICHPFTPKIVIAKGVEVRMTEYKRTADWASYEDVLGSTVKEQTTATSPY